MKIMHSKIRPGWVVLIKHLKTNGPHLLVIEAENVEEEEEQYFTPVLQVATLCPLCKKKQALGSPA